MSGVLLGELGMKTVSRNGSHAAQSKTLMESWISWLFGTGICENDGFHAWRMMGSMHGCDGVSGIRMSLALTG